ncbi:MAG TPA: hypothetical protein VF635_04625 [Propionibacteriaceae bacterium]
MSPVSRRASAPRRIALALTLAACAATALAPVSMAVGTGEVTPADSRIKAPRSVHVRGQWIPIDALGTYRVTGDLIGTLYTLTADTYYQSDAMIIQKGLERFEGCLDLNHNLKCDGGRKGRIATDYIYWATFKPDTARLIKGECIHPITAGDGVFAGLRGFINVNDKTVGKNKVVSNYKGRLDLNAIPGEQVAVSNAPAALSGGASAGNC